ncbi:MAG: LysR family transcriptional regulator [Bacilli bacterium]|nr:LysR family transcriptional regulator [Bacilli bacterium]
MIGLDLKLLRTFVVAARLSNFHQTADRLFLAQPTVTQHIHSLEEQLGVSLFERVKKRVRLTKEGERFLPHALSIIEAYDAGLQDLTSWRQGYQKQLRVDASPIVARTLLPRVLSRFTSTYRDIAVGVEIQSSADIADLVASGTTQVGLGRIPANSADVLTYLLYEDPVLFVAPHDGGDIETAPPDWVELLQTHLLLTHSHPGYWDDLLLALEHLKVSIRTMKVTQNDIARRFVEEGFGVSFLPQTSVNRELLEGRILSVPTPELELPMTATYLLLPPKSDWTEAIESFVATLKIQFPDLQPMQV